MSDRSARNSQKTSARKSTSAGVANLSARTASLTFAGGHTVELAQDLNASHAGSILSGTPTRSAMSKKSVIDPRPQAMVEAGNREPDMTIITELQKRGFRDAEPTGQSRAGDRRGR